MAVFSFVNRNSGSVYFTIETIRGADGFYNSGSLRGALGAYYNFTGSSQYDLVSSDYIAAYIVPPGSSSFEFNPTEYIQTGSVYFRGTGDLVATITGEITSSTYNINQLNGQGILNTLPLENVFQATWDTTKTTLTSSLSNQIVLPLVPTVSGSLYNFTINWGDNTSSSISSSAQSEVTHSYAVAGTYTTKMWGTMRGWRFGFGRDRNKLQSVDKWGGLQFIPTPDGNMAAFAGCQSASFANVIGVPDLRYTNTLRQCFVLNLNLTTVNNLDKWDISGINSLAQMFSACVNFDQNVGSWNVSNVTSLDRTFICTMGIIDGITIRGEGKFNNGGSPSIGSWDTSKVTTMFATFGGQPLFNQNVGNWNVSNVTNMSFMFGAVTTSGSFDGRISGTPGRFTNGGSDSIRNWDVSKVTDMQQMFINQALFNIDLGSWNVGSVTNFSAMFASYYTFPSNFQPWQFITNSFNNGGSPSINNWNVSRGTNFSFMFMGNPNFNQNIGNWNVRSGSNFASMFGMLNPTPTYTASLYAFNNGGSPSINNWNTTASTNLSGMFRFAGNFNQPIGNWRVSSVANFTEFMSSKTNADYSVENYDALLNGWASRPVVSGRSINFGTIKYSAAASASRAILTSAPNSWTIVDGGQI